ncbi:MAG: hypothetical protein ACI80V_000002 [Rhodothermales bacterium]|jgi:hypothetical protein
MKSHFHLAIVLLLTVTGCKTAHMDSPLAEETETWGVSGRQGRLNLSRGLTFTFGPFTVEDARFGPIRTDGGFWETLLAPDTRMRQAYNFDLLDGRARVATIGCVTRASEFVDDLLGWEWPVIAEYLDNTYRSGWIDCVIDTDSDGAPTRFVMALDEDGMYENWSGIAESEGGTWGVESRHRYASTPIPSREPLGYLISDREGAAIADVEVINDGAVRFVSGLDRDERHRSAALAGLLLLLPNLDDFFGE